MVIATDIIQNLLFVARYIKPDIMGAILTCISMTLAIPEDAIEYVRKMFADANAEATTALARQPGIHEEQLDFQIFAALDRVGPIISPQSGTSIVVETHWLGGRRHYEQRWEIADIAILVLVRQGGVLVWRKVALLQSKRLYSREIPVVELEKADFVIGIGRLFDRTEPSVPTARPRAFTFTDDCVYGALISRSNQVKRIEDYMRRHNIPVFYNLYNPPTVPFESTIPRIAGTSEDESIVCGCRVLRASEVHGILDSLPTGKAVSFKDASVPERKTKSDKFSDHGWKIESFVADEVLRCREGRLFTDTQDADLRALLYERTAPITSAIAVTVDIPEGQASSQRRRGRRLRQRRGVRPNESS